jgi:hypothetical protein
MRCKRINKRESHGHILHATAVNDFYMSRCAKSQESWKEIFTFLGRLDSKTGCTIEIILMFDCAMRGHLEL